MVEESIKVNQEENAANIFYRLLQIVGKIPYSQYKGYVGRTVRNRLFMIGVFSFTHKFEAIKNEVTSKIRELDKMFGPEFVKSSDEYIDIVEDKWNKQIAQFREYYNH